MVDFTTSFFYDEAKGMYELQLEKFSGPLEKLLELIEAEKLDVSEVSMAKVTDDFLRYLERFREGAVAAAGAANAVAAEEKTEAAFRGDLRVLADFIAVASKLIFLKSRYLLPGLALTEEEEADIKDLEGRLKTYQQLKPFLAHMARQWRANHKSYSRPYFLGRGGGLAPGPSVFSPGKKLDTQTLAAALDGIFRTIKTYEIETETIKEKIVTLEEKISEVLGRIEREGTMQFKNLSPTATRAEMIVAFLAILHLAREQMVLLEQMDNFTDIMVKKK